MKITMERYHSRAIPVISTSSQSVLSFKNGDGMTKWQWNEGYFWSKAKPWILNCASFHHYSIIPSQCPIHNMIIPFIPMSFNHSNVIPSFGCHSIFQMSFYHLDIIPSFRCHSFIQMSFHHSDVIPSFRCHSIIQISFRHSNDIPSFKSHSINHRTCWQYTIISMSFYSFHDHLSMEWHGMTFWWNDRNGVRMMF